MGIDFQESLIFYSVPCFLLFNFIVDKVNPQKHLSPTAIIFWLILIILYTVSTYFSLNIGSSFYSLFTFLNIILIVNIFNLYYHDKLEKLLKFSVYAGLVYSIIFLVNKIDLLPISIKPFGDNFILQVWGHSNLANFLIFPTIYLISTLNNKKPIFSSVVLLLFLIVFSLANSRASIVSILIGIFLIKSSNNYQKIIKKITLVFCALILLLLFIYSSNPLNKTKELLGSRPGYWSQAIKGFLQSPLIGNGPETFSIVNQKFSNLYETGTKTSHNSFFDYLSNNGILFTVIFYFFIIQALRYQKKQKNIYFVLGLVGLICSLLDASWNLYGIFTISLILIFHNFPVFYTTKPSSISNIFIIFLSTIILILFCLKTTSDYLFLEKKYTQSLKFDPFNLNSRLATLTQNIPITLKLFNHEVLVYQKLVETLPLPESQPYYLKLIEIDPRNNLDKISILYDYSYKNNDFEIFKKIGEINFNNIDPLLNYNQKIILAKGYYFYALNLWNSNNQDKSIPYFQNSVKYADGQSHFYIELYNALQNNHQQTEAQKNIDQCLKNKMSQKHCQQYLDVNLHNFESPGIYKEIIDQL